MKNLRYNHDSSLISEEEINKKSEKIKEEIKKLKEVKKSKDYSDKRSSINLLDDKKLIKKVKKTAEEKSKYNPSYIIVIGIGGSNLGTIAIKEAIKGRLYNQKTDNTKILFADTVDSDWINDINKIIKRELENDNNIILNIVSKSGTTTETITNFKVLTNTIKEYKENYQDYIVATSNKNSPLHKLSEENNITFLKIPKKVGGRYSVFSPVGLFPLKMVDVDINKLLEGAKKMREKCLNKKIINNPAAKNAIIQYIHNKENNKNISDLFLFSKDLRSIGKWNKQLIAESLGKEKQENNNKEGITPTVSIGSTDLHSMVQLYLGGPYDKITNFVKLSNNKEEIEIPKLENLNSILNIKKEKMSDVMNAIYEGTKKAFKKDSRPYTETILKDKSPESIGAFLQFKMLETMYLGKLLEINPFNQPNVEEYKEETRRILS